MRYTCRECSRPQVETCSPANCRIPRCSECSRALTEDNRTGRKDRLRLDASTTCDNSTCQFRKRIKQFTPETSDESLDYRHNKNRKEVKSVRCTCDENSITENSDDSTSHLSKSKKTKICTLSICSSRHRDKLLLDVGTTYKSPSKPYDNLRKSYNEVTCICSDNLRHKTEYSDENLYQMKHRSVSCGVCLEPNKSVSTQENYECLAECPFKTNQSTNTQPCTEETCKTLKMSKPCNAKTCPRFVEFRAKGTKVSSTESEVTSCDSSCLKYADVTDDKSSGVEQTTGDGDQPTSDLTKTSSRTSQDQESSEPCSPESCLYHTEEAETVCEAMLRSDGSRAQSISSEACSPESCLYHTEETETVCEGMLRSAGSKAESVASEPCSPDTCWFHTTDEIETSCQGLLKAIGDGEGIRDDGSKKSTASEKTRSTSGRGSKQSLMSEKTLTNITEHDSITSTSGHASKSSLTSHTMSSIERAKLEGRDSCIKECITKVCSTCVSETGDKKSDMSAKQSSAMEATGGITDELLLQAVDLSDGGSKGRRSKLGIPTDGIMTTPSELGSADGDVPSGRLAVGESDGFEYDSNGQLVACRRKDSTCLSPSKIGRHGSADARSRTSSGEIIQYDSKGQVIPRRLGVTGSGYIIQYDSKGEVVPRVTPSGRIIQYDSKGQVIPGGPHHTASRTSAEIARLRGITSSGRLIHLDSTGQVIPRHHTASRTSSEMARLGGVTPSGYIIQYDSKGHVIPRVTSSGRIIEYDSKGQVVEGKKKDRPHHTASRTSSEMARLAGITPSGYIIQYDSKGHVIPRITSSGRIIEYDSKGQVVEGKKKDRPHHTASRTSSEMARVAGITPSGYIIQYDSKGHVIPRITSSGRIIEYDSKGQVVEGKKKDGPHHTASRTSSEMARLAGVTPSGYILQYDSKGQVVPRVTPSGRIIEYDSKGQVVEGKKKDRPHHTASRTSSEMGRLAGVTPSGYIIQYDSKGQVVPRVTPSGRIIEYDSKGQVVEGKKKDRPHHTASRTSSEMARLAGVTPSGYIIQYDSKGQVVPRVTPSGRIIEYDSKGQVVPGRKKDGPHHTASRTSSEMARMGGVTPSGYILQYDSKGQVVPRVTPSGRIIEYDPTGQAVQGRKKERPHHTASRTSSEMARLGGVTPSGQLIEYDSTGQVVARRRKDVPHHTDSRTSSEMARLGGARGPQVTPSGRIVEVDSKGQLVQVRKKDGSPLHEFDEYDETGQYLGKTKGRGRGEPGGDESGEEFDAYGRRLPQKPSDFSTTLDHGTKGRGGPGGQDEDTPSRGRGVRGVDSSLTKLLSASDDKRGTSPGAISDVKGFLEYGDMALDGKGAGPGREKHLPGCHCKKCKKIGCSCGVAEGFQPSHPLGCHCNSCKLTICRCDISGPKSPNDCGCNACDESKHPDNCDCVDCLCDPSRFQKDKGDHDRHEARDGGKDDDEERRGRGRRDSQDDEGGRGRKGGRRGSRGGCGGKGGRGRKSRKGRRGKGRDEESEESSSTEHISDCDCDECLCAPSDISAGKKPRNADVHPPNCDCVDCICKPCQNRLCVIKKTFVCPTLMPLAKRPHPDCKCEKCICDECLHVPDCKCHECKCRRCADEKAHRAKQKCTCPDCICNPCGDTTKHPRDEYHGEDCTCTDCLCAPCDDTRVAKEKARHPPTCVCYLCTCKNCADPRINPPSHGPSMFQSLVQSANVCNFTPIKYEIPHGPNCKCVTCTCRACDEPKSFVQRDPSKSVGVDTHGPDCYCPQCFCNPCKSKQDANTPAPVLDAKKECVCDKCTCNPCDDPIFLTARDKENMKNQQHGDGCQCPTCLAAANKARNHGEGCQCPLCLAEAAAAKRPHHGDGCMCPLCLPAEAKHGPDCKCPICVCKPCEMDAKPPANEHGPNCKCPICVCKPCEMDAKPPANEHGPNCKCPICVCKPCEMDTKPSAHKHGPNCKCPVCVCDPCGHDEPVQDHGGNCKCAVCKPEVADKKVTPDPCDGDGKEPGKVKQHGPNCKCPTCTCDPCDKDGKEESDTVKQHGPNCKCPTCTCDPCDKDEPEKQEHGPDCKCRSCVCSPCKKDTPAGQTQSKRACTCDSCVCDPCDDPTFQSSGSTSRQPSPGPDCICEEEPVKQGVDYKYIDQLIEASKAPVSCVCNSKGKPISHPPGCRCSPCSKKAAQVTTQGTSSEVYTKSTQCVCKKKHLQSAKVSKVTKDKVNKVNRQKEIDDIEVLLANLRAVCCEAKARQAEPPKEPQCNMSEGAMLALMQELRSKTSCNVVQQSEPQKEKGKKGSCFCGSPKTSTTINQGGPATLQITEVSRISDESVLVKWTQPTNSNATGYEITVDDVVQSKIHSSKRTSAVIFGVQSRRRIRIAVHVVTPQGRSGNPAVSVYEG